MSCTWRVVRELTGLSSFTTNTSASLAICCTSQRKSFSSISSNTWLFGSAAMTMSQQPSIRLRKDWVVRLKETREAASSRLRPSRALTIPVPRGTREVEPSILGKFSRVKRKQSSAPAPRGSAPTSRANTRARQANRFIKQSSFGVVGPLYHIPTRNCQRITQIYKFLRAAKPPLKGNVINLSPLGSPMGELAARRG